MAGKSRMAASPPKGPELCWQREKISPPLCIPDPSVSRLEPKTLTDWHTSRELCCAYSDASDGSSSSVSEGYSSESGGMEMTETCKKIDGWMDKLWLQVAVNDHTVFMPLELRPTALEQSSLFEFIILYSSVPWAPVTSVNWFGDFHFSVSFCTLNF